MSQRSSTASIRRQRFMRLRRLGRVLVAATAVVASALPGSVAAAGNVGAGEASCNYTAGASIDMSMPFPTVTTDRRQTVWLRVHRWTYITSAPYGQLVDDGYSPWYAAVFEAGVPEVHLYPLQNGSWGAAATSDDVEQPAGHSFLFVWMRTEVYFADGADGNGPPYSLQVLDTDWMMCWEYTGY